MASPSLVVCAPLPDGVEVLQREADGIDVAMARAAHRIGAMPFELLAHGRWPILVRALLEIRHDGRRRQRRRVQQIRDDVLPAQHGRGARGDRGHRQDAAVAQQAAPIRIRHRHAPEARAVDPADAVVPRQPLVDERVVGIQQIERAAVLAHDAREQQLGFAAQRLADVVVEVGEQQHVRRDLVQVAQLQPLTGERVHQRVGARIRDHAPHLRVEHAGRAQPAGDRQVQQVIVRECCSTGRTTAGSPARGR